MAPLVQQRTQRVPWLHRWWSMRRILTCRVCWSGSAVRVAKLLRPNRVAFCCRPLYEIDSRFRRIVIHRAGRGCSSSAAFCVQYGVQRLRIRGEPWPKYDYSRSCIRAIRDHGPMRWLALRRATMLSDAQNMPSNTIRRSATQTHVPRGRSAPRGHHGRAERVLPSGQCASKHLGRELRYRISQLGVIHRPQGRPQLLRCHHTQQPVVNRGRGRLRCRRRRPAGQLG